MRLLLMYHTIQVVNTGNLPLLYEISQQSAAERAAAASTTTTGSSGGFFAHTQLHSWKTTPVSGTLKPLAGQGVVVAFEGRTLGHFQAKLFLLSQVTEEGSGQAGNKEG